MTATEPLTTTVLVSALTEGTVFRTNPESSWVLFLGSTRTQSDDDCRVYVRFTRHGLAEGSVLLGCDDLVEARS